MNLANELSHKWTICGMCIWSGTLERALAQGMRSWTEVNITSWAVRLSIDVCNYELSVRLNPKFWNSFFKNWDSIDLLWFMTTYFCWIVLCEKQAQNSNRICTSYCGCAKMSQHIWFTFSSIHLWWYIHRIAQPHTKCVKILAKNVRNGEKLLELLSHSITWAFNCVSE